MGLDRFMIGVDGKMDVPHVEWIRTFKRIVDDFKRKKEHFVDAKVCIFRYMRLHTEWTL